MTKEIWNTYQNKYRKNKYSQISAALDPELVDKFKKKLKEDNITFPTFLREKINTYLEEK